MNAPIGHMRAVSPVAASIEPASDGSFQRTDVDGRLAHLLPVHDETGAVVDCVAWYPAKPGCWWLERRAAVVLGARVLRLADWLDEPVHLYGTPVAWLRGAAQGDENACAVLDWDIDPRSIFKPGFRIRCATPALAARLKQAYWRCARPAFHIEVADHGG